MRRSSPDLVLTKRSHNSQVQMIEQEQEKAHLAEEQIKAIEKTSKQVGRKKLAAFSTFRCPFTA